MTSKWDWAQSTRTTNRAEALMPLLLPTAVKACGPGTCPPGTAEAFAKDPALLAVAAATATPSNITSTVSPAE
jgi:hypothetical protein